MKTILSACAVVFLFAGSLFAQTDGALLPEVSPVFLNANGSAPAANGFVCTFAAGTTTLLATYADSALMTANQNPIRLNAGGRPNNSGTLISIYMQAASYKINVYATGTGNTCNGVSVGTLIRSIDNVYDIGQLIKAGVIAITSFKINNIRYCNAFAGANAGAKIVACIADLPATGGTADARGIEGAQSVTQNIMAGVTKPVTLLLGAATFTATAAQTLQSSNLRIIGLGPSTIWQYSGGATTYIWGDNGSTSTLYFQDEISDMKILGNASVTNGLNINSMHHSVFRNLSIGNVAGACFWIGFAVTNDYDNPHCTNNDMSGGAFSTTPVNGMLFQGLDSTHYATASPINKPVIESVSGSGIKLRYSQALKFIAGTSESNNINIEATAGGNNQADSFDSMDLEAPGANQILSATCSFCTWTNILQSNTAAKGAHFTGGTGNIINGGEWTNLVIDAAAVSTVIQNPYYATNGAGCGGFTDNGTGTLIYRIIKYDCTTMLYTPYTNIGIVDGLDLWNQQAQPTTGYIRQSQASQAGVDLLQFTDYTRGTVLSRVFSSGGMRIGRSDQGNVALQIGDGTHTGSAEFLINGTRYGVLGGGTSSTVALTLENGAKFAINNTGHFSKTISSTTTWDPGNVVTGNSTSVTFGVTGAAFGDTVLPSLAEDLSGVSLTGYVSSAGNVTVVLTNNTGSDKDLGSATLRVDLWQH